MEKVLAIFVSLVVALPAVVGTGGAALGAAFAAPVDSLADSASLRGFEALPFESDIDLRFRPFGLDSDRTTLVTIRLEGDPVSLVQAKALPQKLSVEQKDAIKQTLKERQDALRPGIEGLGGKVVAQYQVAYNGMKVQIPRSRLADLAGFAEVLDISPVGSWVPAHTASVPLLGTLGVWEGVTGFRGEGVKIAILDTGIDYTHANFGGPGTVAAFEAADAADTLPAPSALFGPAAPKVKGGFDLVGDAYTGSNAPQPDPNPLDCNGHGSHVSGTAAGFGVAADGSTYAGAYDAATFTNAFRIGPGVAPMADIYMFRVFGCTGGSRVVVDAIEMALDTVDPDIISMSLGSIFGLPDAASSVASNNAVAAGVVVVASAGNSGASPYIVGSPSVADGAISVAASEALASFPGASLGLTKAPLAPASIVALNANERPIASGTSWDIFVLRNPDGSISLGCDEEEWSSNAEDIAGKLVVSLRGVCARVDRAIFGQRHGAAAAAMINNAPGYPPLESNIFDGTDLVTIPFLGVRGVDGPTLIARDGGTAAFTAATPIANTNFLRFAGFTSGGPRNKDSFLKPDITAPGVSTLSTAVGTGSLGTRLSGTSMSAPHVAGVAALVIQAHPTWAPEDIKAAIVNTGNPSAIPFYRTSRGGTGLVQPFAAASTQAVAAGDEPGDDRLVSLNFGFSELTTAGFGGTKTLLVKNHGDSPVTFTLAAAGTSGTQLHAVALSASTITVPAGGTVAVDVTLTVVAATVGNSMPTPPNRHAFREVVGLVTLTPVLGSNNGVTLRVPYYFVPRPLSKIQTEPLATKFDPGHPITAAKIRNPGGAIGGFADFYALGLEDRDDGLGEIDLRAVGVQSIPITTGPLAGQRFIVFAVNTHGRWNTPSVIEFDILLDTNGDGVDDFAVVGVDIGAVLAGAFDGRFGSFVFNLATGGLVAARFALAPTDSSTALLPFVSGDVGLTPANPRFSYHAFSFSLRGRGDDFAPGRAKFNAFSPAISVGQFILVAPGVEAPTTLTIDPVEWELTRARGVMIVTLDNAAGTAEAQLIKVPFRR